MRATSHSRRPALAGAQAVGFGAQLIPGSPEMFAFPSTLYQQLQIGNAQNNPKAVAALLDSLKTVLDGQAKMTNDSVESSSNRSG